MRVLAAVLVLFSVPALRAQPRSSIRVLAEPAACPSREALVAQLRRVLKGHDVGEEPAAPPVRVQDLGDAYEIEVRDTRKRYADGGRRCEERARVAAILVALVLEPPEAPPLRLPERPPPAPAPRPPGGAGRTRVELEVVGMLDGAPGTDTGLLSGGGGLRLLVGGTHLLGGLGLSVLSPVALLAEPALSIWRFPIDLSARFLWRWGRLEAGVEGGVLLPLVLFREQLGQESAEDVGLIPGLRLAALARVELLPRLALLLGVRADITPRPVRVELGPLGPRIDSPGTWLGGFFGVGGALR